MHEIKRLPPDDIVAVPLGQDTRDLCTIAPLSNWQVSRSPVGWNRSKCDELEAPALMMAIAM